MPEKSDQENTPAISQEETRQILGRDKAKTLRYSADSPEALALKNLLNQELNRAGKIPGETEVPLKIENPLTARTQEFGNRRLSLPKDLVKMINDGQGNNPKEEMSKTSRISGIELDSLINQAKQDGQKTLRLSPERARELQEALRVETSPVDEQISEIIAGMDRDSATEVEIPGTALSPLVEHKILDANLAGNMRFGELLERIKKAGLEDRYSAIMMTDVNFRKLLMISGALNLLKKNFELAKTIFEQLKPNGDFTTEEIIVLFKEGLEKSLLTLQHVNLPATDTRIPPVQPVNEKLMEELKTFGEPITNQQKIRAINRQIMNGGRTEAGSVVEVQLRRLAGLESTISTSLDASLEGMSIIKRDAVKSASLVLSQVVVLQGLMQDLEDHQAEMSPEIVNALHALVDVAGTVNEIGWNLMEKVYGVNFEQMVGMLKWEHLDSVKEKLTSRTADFSSALDQIEDPEAAHWVRKQIATMGYMLRCLENFQAQYLAITNNQLPVEDQKALK